MTTSIRKILVGTDFSEASERALQHALWLAERLGASVELLHAYALPAFSLPIEGAVMPSASYAAELSTRLSTLLDELVARHAGGKVALRGHLRLGAADEELLDYAKQSGTDLIAVATHGRTGAAHVLMGSVAERLVRHSAIPVLTVRVPK